MRFKIELNLLALIPLAVCTLCTTSARAQYVGQWPHSSAVPLPNQPFTALTPENSPGFIGPVAPKDMSTSTAVRVGCGVAAIEDYASVLKTFQPQPIKIGLPSGKYPTSVPASSISIERRVEGRLIPPPVSNGRNLPVRHVAPLVRPFTLPGL